MRITRVRSSSGCLPWLRDDFVRQHRLRERERAAAPYGRYPTLSATEQLWGLTAPMFSRIRSTLAAAQMRAGIMNRSPFLDLRAAPLRARPSAQRARDGARDEAPAATRHEGIAPRRVPRAAPGAHRDHDAVHARAAAWSRAPASSMRRSSVRVLAELGIVDADRLRSDWREYLADRAGPRRSASTTSIQTETWLRTHLEAGKEHRPHTDAAGGVIS